MVTVEVDPVRVESWLAAGKIGCPRCGDGVLAGWGHARARWIEGWRIRFVRGGLGAAGGFVPNHHPSRFLGPEQLKRIVDTSRLPSRELRVVDYSCPTRSQRPESVHGLFQPPPKAARSHANSSR